MWGRLEHRLALLEIWSTALLRRKKGNAEAWDELSRLPWTRKGARRDELLLVPEHRTDLERLLDRSWPDWRAVEATLSTAGFNSDLRGWRKLKDAEREAALPSELPGRLNRRTAAASVAEHSKATITEQHLKALGDLVLTQDGLVRMRPSRGLRIRRGDRDLDAMELAAVTGEAVVTERALQDGTMLTGEKPRAILLVENPGTFVDIAVPSDWLIAQVPGWNTATVLLLLRQLSGIPVVHFGDLDPNGVRIVNHLRQHQPSLIWAIPEFWREYVPNRALRKPWPSDVRLDLAPNWVKDLAAKGLWLEQEVITLDSRLCDALERVLMAI